MWRLSNRIWSKEPPKIEADRPQPGRLNLGQSDPKRDSPA